MRDFLKSILTRTSYLLVLTSILGAFAAGFYLRGGSGGAEHAHDAAHSGPDAAEPAASTPTTWTCSMHPQIRQPNPGKCPICAMDLIPVGDDDGGSGAPRVQRFSAAAAAIMRVATVPAYRATPEGARVLLGRVEADETRLATIAAWVPGRIEKMHVAFTGEVVAPGEAVVTLYSPELLSALAELRLAEAALSRAEAGGPLRGAMEDNASAARAKLRRLGLSDGQIAPLIREGQGDRIVITAPAAGTVVERLGQEGMYVEMGEAIYRLADLSRVWVNLEAYESDLPSLAPGSEVEFTAEALPGERFTGTVEFIDPVIDPQRRIARVRLSLPNPNGVLRPGMFVRARVGVASARRQAQEPADDGLLMIPATAPLITGKRALVYVMVEAGERPAFESREVVLGSRAGDAYSVLSGLEEGDLVVTHGNFQIDSAVQILAKPSMMNPEILVEQWASRTVAAPEVLKQQLADLVLAHAALADAADHPEMPGHEGALAAFLDALSGVSHDAMPADAHGFWNEMTMKMANDATAALELPDADARAEALDLLAERVAMIQSVFGLVEGRAGGPARAAVPALAPVFDAYLSLQQSLAADDGAEGAARANALHEAARAASGDGLPDAWDRHRETLLDATGAIGSDATLESTREAFAGISNAMIAIAREVGLPPAESLYIAHCPMAESDEGADWIQREKDILNPYYGSGMLTCGYVTETLVDPAAGGEHDHE